MQKPLVIRTPEDFQDFAIGSLCALDAKIDALLRGRLVELMAWKNVKEAVAEVNTFTDVLAGTVGGSAALIDGLQQQLRDLIANSGTAEEMNAVVDQLSGVSSKLNAASAVLTEAAKDEAAPIPEVPPEAQPDPVPVDPAPTDPIPNP